MRDEEKSRFFPVAHIPPIIILACIKIWFPLSSARPLQKTPLAPELPTNTLLDLPWLERGHGIPECCVLVPHQWLSLSSSLKVAGGRFLVLPHSHPWQFSSSSLWLTFTHFCSLFHKGWTAETLPRPLLYQSFSSNTGKATCMVRDSHDIFFWRWAMCGWQRQLLS